MPYPRDLHGYGPNPPFADWPGGAAIAVQFVVNYEEGGENNILHGDAASEAFLSEIVGAAPWPGQRHWNMESIYEYGARAGFWRLHRILTERQVPVTVYGIATALARSPAQVQAMLAADWEIASHGLKWIEYKDFTPEAERADMVEAIRLHTEVTGSRPRGWYTGRCSVNTVDIASEQGFDYLSDAYADDLPYWHWHQDRPQLVIPYTLDANDMRFATPQGFNSGDQFFAYLKDSFDVLYAEGLGGAPKMMNIGLHCRLAGRPGRAAAVARFIDYVEGHDKVWLARRIDIAEHWRGKASAAGTRAAAVAACPRPNSSSASAAFSSIRPGSPSEPGRWTSAPPTIPRPGCTMHSAAFSARRAPRNASRCSTRIPISPGDWRQRNSSRHRPPASKPQPVSTP